MQESEVNKRRTTATPTGYIIIFFQKIKEGLNRTDLASECTLLWTKALEDRVGGLFIRTQYVQCIVVYKTIISIIRIYTIWFY